MWCWMCDFLVVVGLAEREGEERKWKGRSLDDCL